MELIFVNNSYFKQLFQNLKPKLQYSKSKIFMTSYFGTLSSSHIKTDSLFHIKKAVHMNRSGATNLFGLRDCIPYTTLLLGPDAGAYLAFSFGRCKRRRTTVWSLTNKNFSESIRDVAASKLWFLSWEKHC